MKAMRAICAMCYENVQVGQSLMNGKKFPVKVIVDDLILTVCLASASLNVSFWR